MPSNARIADAVTRGERTLGPFGPAPAPTEPDADTAEQTSIFELYEQNIGLLTPILAEKLQDAEGRYPNDWIEAAFDEAVTNNKRSWRYIERILERWAAEGKNSGQDRGPVERALDPDKYTKGKYAFLFRPDR
jgi:DnaD/phage-associated family protein